MAELVGSGLMAVPVRSSVSLATDQPRVSLLLRSGTRWKYAEVYGIDRSGRPSHGSGSGQHNPAPPAFVEAYKRLVAFDAPAATPWVPDRIEVMLWDFAHTKLPVRRWPAEIPPPPAGTKLPDKGVFKHFIAARYEPAVKSFVGSLGTGEAVAVNGRPASIGYRRVVPEEAYIEQVRTCAWRKIVVKPPAAAPPGCR
jgi:hypothetical protein